jgi:hypothetical protein
MIVRVLAVIVALGTAAAVAFTAARLLYARPEQAAAVAAVPQMAGGGAGSAVTGIVTDNLPAFDSLCGCRPDAAIHYVHWDAAPSMTLAQIMIRDGALPMLELEPYGASLTAIASGRYDTWLRAYARAVRSLHARVLMSYAPEANGNWYSWSHDHSSASAEVAAWRHVVTVFRRAGAHNVTWVWVINVIYRGSGRLASLWPGAGYVNEVGIDGYFLSWRDTFATVFGPTLASLRRITAKPVLITETSATPSAGQIRVLRQVAAGVTHYHLTGFTWFDIDQAGQRGHGKAYWSLDADSAALAAYREILKTRQ